MRGAHDNGSHGLKCLMGLRPGGNADAIIIRRCILQVKELTMWQCLKSFYALWTIWPSVVCNASA